MNRESYLAICGTRPYSHRVDRLVATLGDHDWKSLYDTAPLQFFGSAGAPRCMLERGLVWGHLFDRTTSWPASDKANIIAQARSSDALITRFWGGYLALRATADGIEVLRDPSGHIPCYHVQIDGCAIFTSEVGLLTRAGVLQPEIDWTIVTQAIAYRDWRPEETALAGVSEVLPGMLWRWSAQGMERATAWSPWTFTTPDQEIDDFDRAADLIGRIGGACLSAWAKCFARPLVELSGGFDSSLVATATARANPATRLATVAAIEGDFDETPYARLVADHAGLPLTVCRPAVEAVDPVRSYAAGLPRPCARAFAQSMDDALLKVARDGDADALFSGAGGDNVFSYQQSVLALIDRLRRHGPSGGIATAADIARVADVSIWQVLAKTVRRLGRRERGMPWHRRTGLLASDALAALVPPAGHPWSNPPEGTFPGKRVHVRGLMTIQNHNEGFARLAQAPCVSPLLAQPLMETCLRVPSWLWCKGGQNRAVARAAFAPVLPSEIVTRRTKGAFDGFAAKLLERNRGAIRSLLLDGALARQGIVDRARIEASLSDDSRDSEMLTNVLSLVDVEAWILDWQRP